MKRILFFHDKPKIGTIVSQYLKVEYTFDCKPYSNINEAMDDLKDNQYDLIISKNKIVDTENREIPSATQLLNVLIDRSDKTKFISIGDVDVVYGNIMKYEEKFKLDDLGRDIVSFLEITKEELEYIKLPEFIGVPIKSFYLLNQPCCDIYIRIRKKEGDQYVKRINAEEQLDKDTIIKYENMNLSEFFVRKAHYTALMSQIMNQSLGRLSKAHKEKDSVFEVSGDTFEISQNMLDDIGINAQTVKVARTSMKSMMKTVTTIPSLSNLLREIIQNEGSYSFKRSYLITLFFNKILPSLGWGRGDQLAANLEKMTYVAFFHDCYLKDEELLKVSTADELNALQLDEDVFESVSHHANKASTLIQQFPQCPPGLDVIIRQHHGSLNGIGFPAAFSAGISPMAIAFIVVEDYATRLLEYIYKREKINLKKIFEEMEEKFELPSYRKIVRLLKHVR